MLTTMKLYAYYASRFINTHQKEKIQTGGEGAHLDPPLILAQHYAIVFLGFTGKY